MIQSGPKTNTSRPIIALVGNPNAGKTTVFNAITGAHQKVGNYAGVTVERVSGDLEIDGFQFELVDVPGLYSMRPASEDERVAVEAILGKREEEPDYLIAVVDANNLERNLYFFSQLLELGKPMTVALTMTDVLEASNKRIDVDRLSNELGVPVIPVVGHKGIGVKELLNTVAASRSVPGPAVLPLPQEVLDALEPAIKELAAEGQVMSPAELLDAVFDKAPASPVLKAARERLESLGLNPTSIANASRYIWASRVVNKVIFFDEGIPGRTVTEKIDRIVTHRVYGMALFFALVYVMFQSIYTFATPLMDGIGWLFERLGNFVGPLLEKNEMAQSLVVDGVIVGVGTVVTFLPQILILFFFVAALEGSGYMSRAAFLMDRWLSWCGLNGRAFIPLLSSFACAVPGVMAARVMPDPKSRLATILVAPLMSCSARLPVYLLMIGAFIEPEYGPFWAGVALFGMHLVGLAVSVPVVWFLNRKVIRGKPLPFLLELPPYQVPKWRDVWLAMYLRGKVFLRTAGTVIVALSLVVWALLFFPRSSDATAQYKSEFVKQNGPDVDADRLDAFIKERQIANSYLGRFGKTIEPVFRPAGFDWRISTAILAAFPAREVLVSSLGIIFSLGGEVDETSGDLRTSLRNARKSDGTKLMTPWTAAGLMVFFALCCQCMATLAAVKRETNSWRWPLIMFGYMTLLAYLGAVAVYQVGQFFN